MNHLSKRILPFFMLVTVFGFSQNDESNLPSPELAISLQVYPAGFIPTVNFEHYLSEKSSLVYRLGANIVDRQDFSDENDEETGGGFGGSVGYRRHFQSGKGEFVAGLNLDVWNLWIDWEDGVGTANPTSGNTYTLVLQPWLEAGYFFHLNGRKSQLGITGGFGREINVITNGDDVEQGFIASLTLQYKFKL